MTRILRNLGSSTLERFREMGYAPIGEPTICDGDEGYKDDVLNQSILDRNPSIKLDGYAYYDVSFRGSHYRIIVGMKRSQD